MLRRVDLSGCALPGSRALNAVLPRAALDVETALASVTSVVSSIRDNGYPAARAATLQFDDIDVAEPRVSAAELAQALRALDPDVRAGLVESIRRARIVHEAQARVDVAVSVVAGGVVTERWIPVDRVGLYVPGGLAVYPSSVVMNVVPAQVAGVGSLVVVSPPQREFGGRPHPTILAACALLAVTEVYAIGGAQAIGLLAYGDESLGIDPVTVITGPGNIYVAAAKRLVRSSVGIDAEAGPTEVAILADQTADAVHVAADLISQAEHDPMAASVLVTDSVALADQVDAELVRQVAATKHSQRVTTALSGPQSAIVLVDDMDCGLTVVNAYAAEHLEIITADAAERALRVRNAGAVFVGTYSPVSLGDYCAGSNHVLPTGRTARHASGLNVGSFLKAVHVIDYSRAALLEVAPYVLALADAEDLPAHGAAIKARMP